jgi:hypothetical protein
MRDKITIELTGLETQLPPKKRKDKRRHIMTGGTDMHGAGQTNLTARSLSGQSYGA